MKAPSKNPILIRADAGGDLGSGHIMRMIALAQALQQRSIKAVFASVQCQQNIRTRIQLEGFEHHSLENAKLGDKDDVNQTVELAKHLKCAWIFLDGYHFDLSYQKQIHANSLKVAIMEDDGHCDEWCANLILNQNLGAEGNTYKNSSSKGDALCGCNFALLRKEFQSPPSQIHQLHTPQRILITMGGVDPDDVSSKILNALEATQHPPLNIRILVGGGNPNIQNLTRLSSESKHHVELLKNVSDMPAMYSWADRVVSAGGSTCYEWLLYQKPGAVVVLADNQEPIAKELRNRGHALVLGTITSLATSDITLQLVEWIGKQILPAKKTPVLDAWGARRVAAYLDHQDIWIRPAELSDIQNYFELANDLTVRKNSIQRDQIAWATHKSWFIEKLNTPTSAMFSAFNSQNEFIGQVRFDQCKKDEKHWKINYSITPEFRGKSLGKALLTLAMLELSEKYGPEMILHAWVKLENIPSMRIFKTIGFIQEPEHEDGGLLKFIHIISNKT